MNDTFRNYSKEEHGVKLKQSQHCKNIECITFKIQEESWLHPLESKKEKNNKKGTVYGKLKCQNKS